MGYYFIIFYYRINPRNKRLKYAWDGMTSEDRIAEKLFNRKLEKINKREDVFSYMNTLPIAGIDSNIDIEYCWRYKNNPSVIAAKLSIKNKFIEL